MSEAAADPATGAGHDWAAAVDGSARELGAWVRGVVADWGAQPERNLAAVPR